MFLNEASSIGFRLAPCGGSPHPLGMGIFDRFRGKYDRPKPPGRIVLKAIGYVRNDVAKPRPNDWEEVESTIELLPQHRYRLEGLEQYSHIIVIFYMDLAVEAPDKPEQVTLESGNLYGMFATRSQLRPNHLGVTMVALKAHEGPTLIVTGLDAIDGTPVLDIKPYLPEYDSIEGATIPPG
jgi:tRNA (adenine37-N6)-methyltransferase